MEVSDSRLQVVASARQLPAYTLIIDHRGTPSPHLPSISSTSGLTNILSLNSNPSGSNRQSDTMSQQSNRPADTPDMDDGASEDVPVTQSATTSRGTASGRGRGRGRWARPKNTKIVKPAQQKATSGRGRRHKVYDNLKVQAAHERTQELKQAFLAVGKLVKPAIQEIADRSVNELLEDPTLYKQVPEYGATKKFLRERREATIRQCDDRLRQGLAMAEHVWKAQRQKVMEEFTVSTSRTPLSMSKFTFMSNVFFVNSFV